MWLSWYSFTSIKLIHHVMYNLTLCRFGRVILLKLQTSFFSEGTLCKPLLQCNGMHGIAQRASRDLMGWIASFPVAKKCKLIMQIDRTNCKIHRTTRHTLFSAESLTLPVNGDLHLPSVDLLVGVSYSQSAANFTNPLYSNPIMLKYQDKPRPQNWWKNNAPTICRRYIRSKCCCQEIRIHHMLLRAD